MTHLDQYETIHLGLSARKSQITQVKMKVKLLTSRGQNESELTHLMRHEKVKYLTQVKTNKLYDPHTQVNIWPR